MITLRTLSTENIVRLKISQLLSGSSALSQVSVSAVTSAPPKNALTADDFELKPLILHDRNLTEERFVLLRGDFMELAGDFERKIFPACSDSGLFLALAVPESTPNRGPEHLAANF